MMPTFDTSPLHQFPKFENFLWVCWFLGKNHSNFVPPRMKTPQSVLPYWGRVPCTDKTRESSWEGHSGQKSKCVAGAGGYKSLDQIGSVSLKGGTFSHMYGSTSWFVPLLPHVQFHFFSLNCQYLFSHMYSSIQICITLSWPLLGSANTVQCQG